jgi:hypothetical protein
MYGKYRLSEFLMPEIATLVNIRFNSIQYFKPFHDKTDWYYVWGLTISWQNTLILCLGIHHFMTKQSDTMSGTWLFHYKTDGTMSGDWLFHDKKTLIVCLGLLLQRHTNLHCICKVLKSEHKIKNGHGHGCLLLNHGYV